MAFQDAYDPPVAGGFVVPLLGPRLSAGGRGLPVEKDDIGTLCDRAADGLGNRLSNVSSTVPRWLLKFLGGVVSKALRLGKRRTCADGVVESPRRVLDSRPDGTQVWLGQEEFQYRAYALGRSAHDGHWQRGERGLRIAQGANDAGRNATHHAHQLGRLGFAQAEYYFNGSRAQVGVDVEAELARPAPALPNFTCMDSERNPQRVLAAMGAARVGPEPCRSL